MSKQQQIYSYCEQNGLTTETVFHLPLSFSAERSPVQLAMDESGAPVVLWVIGGNVEQVNAGQLKYERNCVIDHLKNVESLIGTLARGVK